MKTQTLREFTQLPEDAFSYAEIAFCFPSAVDECLWRLGYSRGYNDFWRDRNDDSKFVSRDTRDGYYFGWQAALEASQQFDPQWHELPAVDIEILKNSPHFDWQAFQTWENRHITV